MHWAGNATFLRRNFGPACLNILWNIRQLRVIL